MAQRQAARWAPVERYLALLDAGDVTGAQDLLEEQIEPTSDMLIDDLRVEELRQVRHYTATLAGARHDSTYLLLGTLLTFVLGLGVLAVVGWSNRGHRRVVERMAAHNALTCRTGPRSTPARMPRWPRPGPAPPC